MSTFAEKAAPYLQKYGWAVFPVSRNKVPCVKGDKERGILGGVHLASRDSDQIDAWNDEFPGANVAVACGNINGICVLDVDNPEGLASLDRIFDMGFERFAPTVTARSARGGLHYYFIQPNIRIKNRASKIAPGIDVRSDGGSIIAPPSETEHGRYEWINSPDGWNHDGIVIPAPMPEWLRQKASAERPPNPVSTRRNAGRTCDKPSPVILDMEERELRSTAEGGRNHALNKAAYVFGQFVAADLIGVGEATRRLMAAATSIGLHHVEAEKTIESGLRAGQANPR